MIAPIGAIATGAGTGATPLAGVGGTGLSGSSAAASGGDSFANLLGSAIDSANSVQQNATNLALEGATGQASIADVTVAATEAQLSVQMIAAVRDKAVDAFNSIMSMST